MDPLAVSAYGAEQALPLTGTGTGTTNVWGAVLAQTHVLFFEGFTIFLPYYF